MNPYMYNPFWGYYPGMRLSRVPYSYNNTSSRTPDEVRSYASILVAFDANGKVKWDQSLSLDELKKASLEQVSDYHFGNENVVLLYKDESELKIKTVDIDSGEAKESKENIKLSDDRDEIRNERELEGGVQFWYGTAFYVWGFQTIRNLENKEDRTRDVFYINKVVVK
jgi:hypothetical protein